jgi:hypothetical protein
MTTTERNYLPSVACTPWCEYGDGHPDAVFASDQTCYSERHMTPAVMHGSAGELNVMAHRRMLGADSDVALNIDIGDFDLDVYISVAQARLLIESLTAVVATVDEGQERTISSP